VSRQKASKIEILVFCRVLASYDLSSPAKRMPSVIDLDDIDRHILDRLQNDNQESNLDLARAVGT